MGPLFQFLMENNLTLGVAESCTGGRIASLVTLHAGSSAYFKGGIVAYSNDVKQRVLGVAREDIIQHGAVSKPVVEQMAKGAMKVLESDCAVATTGIAGPGGALPGMPVGSVWIAVAYQKQVVSRLYQFKHDRKGNIEEASETALSMLYSLITDKNEKMTPEERGDYYY